MASILQLSIDRVTTPIGVLLLVGDEAGRLRAVDWTDYEERMVRLLGCTMACTAMNLHRLTIRMV